MKKNSQINIIISYKYGQHLFPWKQQQQKTSIENVTKDMNVKLDQNMENMYRQWSTECGYYLLERYNNQTII